MPLTEVRADGVSGDRRPGVVIAHGFAGSARLMRPLADSVARRGGIAVLLDFAGHGASHTRLPGAGRGEERSRALLRHDLDVAVAWLRGRPGVDPDRVVLVGHSMRRRRCDPVRGRASGDRPDRGDLAARRR
ncbi:alpha/beta fold hydrolase [Micromonospora sp. BRA006-A]|nr:alpha/beta fold hydrolase [Micromonospora sp. BRA006-A]